MKILFLGTLFNKDEEDTLLKKSKVGLQNQANDYQWAIINGLYNIDNISLDIFGTVPVGTYPKYYRELILKNKEWKNNKYNYIEVGAFNLPLFKQFTRFINFRSKINEWSETYINEDKHIIAYSTYLPFLLALYKLNKKIKITMIVTDVPEFDNMTSDNNKLLRLIRKLHNKLIYILMKRIDSFVLITEQMKEILKIDNKDYTIIEGIIDDMNDLKEQNRSQIDFDNSQFIIMYAGTLNYSFGICELIEAFGFIEQENIQLWICGSGEAEKMIIDAEKNDRRIKFLGFLSREKINEIQNDVSVFINPRNNKSDFTKYSFPSKTLKYMATGKPVIMYKLDGIPDEYDEHLYYITGTKPVDIANKIKEIYNTPREDLWNFGEKAKKFVNSNKNANYQVKKLVELLKIK